MTYRSPQWDDNPPAYAGQSRRHNVRELSPARGCNSCGGPFWSRKASSKWCDACKRCPVCGTPKQRPEEFCIRHAPVTQAKRKQLEKLHASMYGQNNPAKRSEVASKIGKGVKANHPPRLYPEKWVAQALFMRSSRPPKRSKLEESVAKKLPEYDRYYRIGPYEVDFADPGRKVIVEVQGCWWQCCQPCFPESPVYPRQRQCVGNDQRKLTYLESSGWKVEYLWEHDLRSEVVPDH